MKMTLILVFMGLIATCNHAGYAQGKIERLMAETTPEARAEMQTENMVETLSLSDSEKKNVMAINLKYARRMQGIYDSGQGRMQRFRQMKTVSEEKDLELKKVLTATQYRKYSENKQEMKDNIRAKAKEKR
jgi:hypothetical protein